MQLIQAQLFAARISDHVQAFLRFSQLSLAYITTFLRCLHNNYNILALFEDNLFIVALDSYGASLLKRNWQDIGHIAMAHEVLGLACRSTRVDEIL